MKVIIFNIMMIYSYCMLGSYDLALYGGNLSVDPGVLSRVDESSSHYQADLPYTMLQRSSNFYRRNPDVYRIRQICGIVSEAYGISAEVVAEKLQGKTLDFQDLEVLRRNVLAQAHNKQDLKKYLARNPSISINDLKVLLLYADGKQYYEVFQKFDQDVVSVHREECYNLVAYMLQKKIDQKKDKHNK